MSHLEHEVSACFYQLALIFPRFDHKISPLFNHKTSGQWLAFKILCSLKNLKFALSSFSQKKKVLKKPHMLHLEHHVNSAYWEKHEKWETSNVVSTTHQQILHSDLTQTNHLTMCEICMTISIKDYNNHQI